MGLHYEPFLFLAQMPGGAVRKSLGHEGLNTQRSFPSKRGPPTRVSPRLTPPAILVAQQRSADRRIWQALVLHVVWPRI